MHFHVASARPRAKHAEADYGERWIFVLAAELTHAIIIDITSPHLMVVSKFGIAATFGFDEYHQPLLGCSA